MSHPHCPEQTQKCNANGTYNVRMDNGEEYDGVTAAFTLVTIAIIINTRIISMMCDRYA